MKKLLSDFKAFISRGNILDMAVGVIIGGAFSKIVTSLVNDIIMPLIAWAFGASSVSSLALVLNGVDKLLVDGTPNPKAILWHYGNFIQTIIDFFIVAICIFAALQIIIRLKKFSTTAAEDVKKTLLSNKKKQNKGNGDVENQKTDEQKADEIERRDGTV